MDLITLMHAPTVDRVEYGAAQQLQYLRRKLKEWLTPEERRTIETQIFKLLKVAGKDDAPQA